MNKNIRAAIRFRETEYSHIQELAKQSGQSVSNYIRAKLFEDESEYNAFDSSIRDLYDELKELKRLQIMASIFTKELAKHVLNDDTYTENIKKISNRLSELGYE